MTLELARAAHRKASAAIASHDFETTTHEDAVLVAQAALLRHKKQRPALDAALADAQRRLDAAEEADLLERTIAASTYGLSLFRDNSVAHWPEIVALHDWVTAATPSEFDTPINRKYSVHPIVLQFLALIPAPGPLDTPITNFTTPRSEIRKRLFATQPPIGKTSAAA